jgi:hypothetical protein
MKKNRRDKPTGIIIHIYMEMSSDIVAIFILNKQKCHFSSTKLENRRAEQVLWGTGRGQERGGRRGGWKYW